MTPQELMDLDGAGSAAKQCKADGNWDEDAGKSYKQFYVMIDGYIAHTEKITVSARSEEEAYNVAENKSDQYFDHDYVETYDAKEIK